MRVYVKRILWKYGYPPDKQEEATQLVIEQAEVLAPEWALQLPTPVCISPCEASPLSRPRFTPCDTAVPRCPTPA